MSEAVQFLHIGDYKTGTTWLQRHVLGADDRIYLVGEGGDELEAELWAALETLTYATEFDAEQWAARFSGLMRERSIQRSVIAGISRESLICGDPFHFHNWREMAQRLRQVFGPVKIIITFRNIKTLLPSLYSTYIKIGGTKSMKDLFLDPARLQHFHERLNYSEIKTYYINLFGEENCLFLNYEELRQSPEKFVGGFYEFIGLQPPSIESTVQERPNPSLTVTGATFQRYMNHGVRSMFNRRSVSPILESLIAKGIRLVKQTDTALQKRRLSHLDAQTLSEMGGEFPIENTHYLAGIRAIAERISWGRPLMLDPQVAAEVDSAKITFGKNGND